MVRRTENSLANVTRTISPCFDVIKMRIAAIQGPTSILVTHKMNILAVVRRSSTSTGGGPT